MSGTTTEFGEAKTPPFPENGPGLRPTFDGVELVLMGRNTPPEMLLSHMEKLGNEITTRDGDILDAWPEMTPELAELLSLESITSWDFDLMKLNDVTKGKPLSVLAYALIESFDLIATLKIDAAKLKRYLLQFERTYNPCLYHNPMHAADVMHAFCFLLREKLASAIPPHELLIAVLAGPAHDLGHPGVNNALLIKQKHPVSVKYPTSVLENHHAALAVEFLQDPEKDVLSFLDDKPERKRELRDLLKELVLYTDMSLHGKLMEKLTELAKNYATLDLCKQEDRVCSLQTLLRHRRQQRLRSAADVQGAEFGRMCSGGPAREASAAEPAYGGGKCGAGAAESAWQTHGAAAAAVRHWSEL